MATNTIQILIDGPRNTVAKVTGDDTQNSIVLPANTVVLDPATLTSMLPTFSSGPKATLLRIDSVQYSISDGISIQLLWKATTNVMITELAGRGRMEAVEFGGFQNNAGAGVNGQILMTVVASEDVAVAANVTWTLTIETVKQIPGGQA